MELSHPFPRMAATQRERVTTCLAKDCDCGGTTATLRQRLIRASVTVNIQCDTCGHTLSGALPRAEHYEFQNYTVWDDNLADAYEAKRRQEWEGGGAERRAWYRNDFLRSPEWRVLRDRVMERAKWVCESCLSEPASDVHHTTYAYGQLPPAWILRAVCRRCHGRQHEQQEAAQ